jgi:hypothetical protein
MYALQEVRHFNRQLSQLVRLGKLRRDPFHDVQSRRRRFRTVLRV